MPSLQMGLYFINMSLRIQIQNLNIQSLDSLEEEIFVNVNRTFLVTKQNEKKKEMQQKGR